MSPGRGARDNPDDNNVAAGRLGGMSRILVNSPTWGKLHVLVTMDSGESYDCPKPSWRTGPSGSGTWQGP